MLRRMLFKSSIHRPGVLLWTTLTLTLCAALVTLFATTTLQVNRKMTGALAELGANAVAAPARHAGSRPVWAVLFSEAREAHARSALLHLRVGLVKGLPVAVVAARPGPLAMMTPYWRITGRRPESAGTCLVGARVARRLTLAPGDSLKVAWGTAGGASSYRITGILSSGDEDDGRVFVKVFGIPSEVKTATSVSPAAEKRLKGPDFTYALLSVPGGARGVARLAATLRASDAGLAVNPFRQILYGEGAVLNKVDLLCGLALAAVFLLSVLGLSAAVASRVLTRAREISLLRALGAKRRWVAGFLVAEMSFHGLIGGLAGFCIGTWMAQGVGRHVFETSFSPSPEAFAVALTATVLVAAAAGAAGVRRALKLDPGVLLRSE